MMLYSYKLLRLWSTRIVWRFSEMPEFPLLKSQSGQVEWNGGSTCYVGKVLLVLVLCVCLCYQVLLYKCPMILAKVLCLERRTVRIWVHYTSGIASYKALQKGSFKKPWYRLNVRSHVSYFANIMRRSCLFCRLHPLHHPLHSCPCPPNSFSSSFLLCFILAPCLPLISGECSTVVFSSLVILFICLFTMRNLVIAFFTVGVSLLHHMCTGCMVW